MKGKVYGGALLRGARAVAAFVLAAALLASVAPALGADYANPQLLVSPEDVAKNAGRWIVLDCRDKADTVDKKTNQTLKGYDSGHIPGAISLGGDCGNVLREKPNSTVFKDPKVYEDMLGNAGIDNSKTLVVYGDVARITSTSVGFWVLEWLGHKDVRFLNGGIEAWEAAGKKLDTTPHSLSKAKFVPNPETMKKRIATTEEVKKIASGEAKDAVLVDARSAKEYTGEDVRAKRGGHIPMCDVNVTHTGLYDKATGTIKPMDELEKLYAGLDKGKRTIPYCQTGTRSTLSYLTMRLAGFKDVANYDDSWIIWGNTEDLPVAK